MWKIGKSIKNLLDHHGDVLNAEILSEAYLCWGSLLSQLATSDEDVTIAQASGIDIL